VTRRDFVRHATVAAAGIALGGARGLPAAAANPRTLFTGVGITASLARAAEMKIAGADYLVPAVADFLMPDNTEAEFAVQRELAAASPLPVLGCNSFLRHPRLRCTGPDADHATVLAFCAIAFRRLASVGGRFIGFGSNTARQIPDGWPRARADEQFIALLRAMAPLAAEHGITISVEQQRPIECNYINHLAEAVAVVAPVNHPNIRVLADLFHMAVVGDTPGELARAMPWVGLVELAEKANRTLPGVAGDDFRPYFAVLARGGYSGAISIEGDGTPERLQKAFATIRAQAAEVAG
jgi:sugar phosphate isomerase/epimerase